jgi:tRNA threonylcarbamoyladenosine biosynthesis protein TsaE
VGSLGSGKTQFAKGLARGLGVRGMDQVCSPTYTIVNEYAYFNSVAQKTETLFHVDFYRVEKFQDLEDIGFYDFAYSNGICVIEWMDRYANFLPPAHATILFTSIETSVRRIQVNIGCFKSFDIPKFMLEVKSVTNLQLTGRA